MEAASSNPTHNNIISTANSAVSHRNPLRADWPTVDGPLGLTEEDSVDHARRFFKFGFLLLPWLWAVNCFYFWPVIRRPTSYYHPDLRRFGYNILLDFSTTTSGGYVMSTTYLQCKYGKEWTVLIYGRQNGGKILKRIKYKVFPEVCHGPFVTQDLLLCKDVVKSAIGFTVFVVILSTWALTFSIGGERLFGHAWNKLVMYNVAEKYGLTGVDLGTYRIHLWSNLLDTKSVYNLPLKKILRLEHLS